MNTRLFLMFLFPLFALILFGSLPHTKAREGEIFLPQRSTEPAAPTRTLQKKTEIYPKIKPLAPFKLSPELQLQCALKERDVKDQKDECRMEACSKFYGLVGFLMTFFPGPISDNVTMPWKVGSSITGKCKALPRLGLWDPPAILQNLFAQCIYDNDILSPLANPACMNPWYNGIVHYYDECPQCDIPGFDPNKQFIVCLNNNFSLQNLSEACAKNCCLQ